MYVNIKLTKIRKKVEKMRKINTNTRLQYVTWGGCLNYQNGSLVTFFHYDLKE